MTTTAWGDATVVEEVSVPQSSTVDGETKEFATVIALLEGPAGESLVRFAYSTSTGGVGRRGPVTLRPADMLKLRKALRKAPRLRAALVAVLG